MIGTSSSVAFLMLIFAASYAVENPWRRLIMILVGLAILLMGTLYSLKIEREAGYYECPHCGQRYVPTLKAVVFAPHIGRSCSMKCPHCGQRGYHKKVLTR